MNTKKADQSSKQPHNQNSMNESTQRQTTVVQQDQYLEYVNEKKLQSLKQNEPSSQDNKLFVVIISIFVIILFTSAVVYMLRFKTNSQYISPKNNMQIPDHLYTRHEHHAAPPAPPASSSDLCSSALPYTLFNEANLKKQYYQWYGKVGSNINGRTYEQGHFIERHVAVNGKCTDEQTAEGKSIFYDWNEVNKAFSKTTQSKCPLSDRTTFSYDFQYKIASPSEYIKGIDCRSGSIRNYSRVFVLYRRAIKNSRPSQDQYLGSNYVTIWTFYPKN